MFQTINEWNSKLKNTDKELTRAKKFLYLDLMTKFIFSGMELMH